MTKTDERSTEYGGIAAKDPYWPAITKTLAWPLIVLLLALIFQKPIASFIGRTNEITASRNGVTAKAVAAMSNGVAADPANSKLLHFKKILWVDDVPSNNKSLIQAFTTLGVQVDEALDTPEAEAKLKTGHYDLIITDMGRDRGPRAGLDQIKEAQLNHTPVIIFSSSWAPEHYGQERAYGVQLITYDEGDVYKAALKMLLGGGA
jgi:CheY-like chemotaxis protein